MVIRKKGSVFFIDGKEFKIGGGVFANDESEYMGLYGTVTEIRTDEDRETENDTPDIYCEFMSPDSVAMAAELVTCSTQRLHERMSRRTLIEGSREAL